MKLLHWPPDDASTRGGLASEEVLEWGRQLAAQVNELGRELQS